MISAVVLTKNESQLITKCIDSLLFCSEIIIIDDFSSDDTIGQIQKLYRSNRNKSKNYNERIKIYERKLDNDFSAQRNFGLEKASKSWVLFIDADEIVSEQLAAEIQSEISDTTPKANGFLVKRDDIFLGEKLKHGETAGIWLLRLGQKKGGKWAGRVHEQWIIAGNIGKLQQPLLHQSHQEISSFLSKINRYSDLVASQWKQTGRHISFWEIPVYPICKFLYNYVFRLGLADGIPGLIMACMMSFHSFLARAKYWLKQSQRT